MVMENGLGADGGLEALKLRALEFLKKNKEPVVYLSHGGGWNFVGGLNKQAKELSQALDDGRHSGHSFGEALKDLIHTATTDLGYTLKEEIKDGKNVITLTPEK